MGGDFQVAGLGLALIYEGEEQAGLGRESMGCVAIAMAAEPWQTPRRALETGWPCRVNANLGRGAGPLNSHIYQSPDAGSPREEV